MFGAAMSAASQAMGNTLDAVRAEFPVGTKVTCEDGPATVTGHVKNLLGIPLVDVRTDHGGSSLSFYAHEIRKLA